MLEKSSGVKTRFLKKTKTYLFRSPFVEGPSSLCKVAANFCHRFWPWRRIRRINCVFGALTPSWKKGCFWMSQRLWWKTEKISNVATVRPDHQVISRQTSKCHQSGNETRYQGIRLLFQRFWPFFIFSEKIPENRRHCMIYRETPNRGFWNKRSIKENKWITDLHSYRGY